MAVAYDAASNVAAGTTGLSWTHTPTGTPRGVIVLIAQNVGTTDEVTGCTYGGVTMTEIAGSPLAVTSGSEDGALYGYFLGSSIPTGAQTVSVSVNGTGSTKRAVCVTVTANTDTVVEDTTATDLGVVSNASVNVTIGNYVSAFVMGVLHSGVDNVSPSLEAGSGYTDILEHDYGSQTASWIRRSSIVTSAGDYAVVWSSPSDDAGVLAIAVREALFTIPLDQATETDDPRTLTSVHSRALDMSTETDASRNMAMTPVSRVFETDSSRTIVPLTASWPAFNGTRTFIPLTTSTIDSSLSGAASGTVFVLTNQPRPTPSAGITGYTWASSLPAGVTLRGNPIDATGQSISKMTIVVLSSVTIGDDCTLRDMYMYGVFGAGFSFSGKAWFENCVLGNTIADAPPSSSGDYVVFSRCTFAATGDIPLFDDDGVAAGGYYFYDCLFLDNRTSGTSPLIKTFAGDITFVNCTFGTTLTDWFDADPGATGAVTFTNCVFAEEVTDLTALGSVSGSSNWGVASPAVSIGQTVATSLHLDDANYWNLTPTNRSPFRAGGTTTARTHAGAMTLDRGYLPYATSTPSAGCFQWKPASSCLYKARASDPLDGFAFTYGATTLDTTYLEEFEPTLFKSHLDVAAVVRSYVWDLIHPSRGYFYTTWDGYYRLLLHVGQFDLTTTSPSSKIFGATTLTAEEDTG